MITCAECFAEVRSENAEIHAKWHAYIERAIDIATSTRRQRKSWR